MIRTGAAPKEPTHTSSYYQPVLWQTSIGTLTLLCTVLHTECACMMVTFKLRNGTQTAPSYKHNTHPAACPIVRCRQCKTPDIAEHMVSKVLCMTHDIGIDHSHCGTLLRSQEETWKSTSSAWLLLAAFIYKWVSVLCCHKAPYYHHKSHHTT